MLLVSSVLAVFPCVKSVFRLANGAHALWSELTFDSDA